MMRLGIDIDGTIKDTHRAAIMIYNEELQRSVKTEDVNDFYLDEAFGLTPQEGRNMWRRMEERIYSLGLPLPHASEVLNQLHTEGHEIFYVTARPKVPGVERVTKRWLQEHGFPYREANLTMNSFNKAEIAKRLQLQLFFEDAPEHLERFAQHHFPTVIVDAPYNRHLTYPMERITDWREVPQLIDRLMLR